VLAARLSNLGRALEFRHRRTGDLDSLREAIQAQRRALTAAPPDHADRTIYQLNLSGTLRALFHRTGYLEVLDEAFAVAREAVAELPTGHPFRINHLSNLATIHQMRYAHTADPDELDTAATLLRAVLADTATTHPQRPALLSVLGEVLHARSEHTGDVQQLDEATRTTHDALDTVAEDDPHRGTILHTLADLYETRHRTLGDEEALSEAIKLLRTAAAHRTSSVRSRVDAARQWGTLAASAGLTELAGEGFATAVELLPLLAARGLRRHDSEYWLSQFGGLASDAAALALRSDTPDRAVELLELGRTVLMAQALDIRTDLSTLREHDSSLADRFEWLSTRLETEDGEPPESQRAIADELDKVIAAVRDIAGMDSFLLPPTAAHLLDQTDQGPIVMVNVSAYRSDALLLTKNGLHVQELPQLTPDAVSDQVGRFLTALRTDCHSPFRQARERGEQAATSTLSWLWNTVAAPVLNALDPAPGQRVWWVPTGMLSFLPLHAASSEAGESVLDRIVSSYTPSVRALTHARAIAGEQRSGRTLIVGMPHTPNASDLPSALRETGLVAERAPTPHTIVGPDATRAAVTAALRNSTWAHFACHATTAPSPSDSHLLLHDHEQRPLNAATISRERLLTAAFAYLSACDTAVPTTDLVDEVIHIASAFHLAGFPRVIGTLWPVDDTAATTIAEQVYTDITADLPDPDRAPKALRDATVHIRGKHPHQPSLWASHIHIGI
jgi:CHAT domain-containing protein